MTLRSQPVELDRDEFWQRRECTRRDCGNNLRRKINPRDYDSVLGFLCDECQDNEDARPEPEWCPVCGVRKGDDHDGPYPCSEENEVVTIAVPPEMISPAGESDAVANLRLTLYGNVFRVKSK